MVRREAYLKTKEKLFCRCQVPTSKTVMNTTICPRCTGQGGSKPMLPNKSAIKIIRFLKKALITVSILIIVIQCLVHFKATEQLRSKSKLRGIWKTELFIIDKDTLAPLITDSKRWKYFIIDYKEKAIIKLMNDTINRYSITENIDKKEIVFKGLKVSDSQKFNYSISNKSNLKLEGYLNEKELKIELTKVPKTKFKLLNRGFHWINETTYNY